ncbi:Uncharacterized protein BP5553_02513 [Venustampulla echinocandica]|uniref:Ubiquitin-protein ligase sel1 n=1 Tax=Venustampulla echinocandica TaxID=2656787 RepID=A0A370U432_9HELO|nr:Uncharacterized protein BP5553_02513 [Venustampulla echinocandica]RDL42534.1 Uncharacterized protein BP5553_02513 [Venustampulla echinocandica]
MPGIYSRQAVVQGNGGDLFFVDDNPSFWWTRTGQIVRWSVLLGIFFLIIAFMAGGYWHAKRRINKGLKPLGYHRWLLNRQQRARYDPAYQNPSVYYHAPQGGHYGMNHVPPPMYDPSSQRPPVYQPPAGGSKVDPSQGGPEPIHRPADNADPAPQYEPPPGPPPAAVHANHTGSSTVSNNPYRQ